MGAITRIAWCGATFNPWVGCLRLSTACDRCYAAALSWRFGWRDGKGRDLWDVSADRKRTSFAYWRGPLRWNERAQAEGMRASRSAGAARRLARAVDASGSGPGRLATLRHDLRTPLRAIEGPTRRRDFRPQYRRKPLRCQPQPAQPVAAWLHRTP
jgi:signal transduction histidine kinase